ncbi:MAG: hypothetical protein C4617_04495 [Candidatus Liberibacter europaeus]|uniref:Uncharacterized protein n=1 Tax=Candidatus Liberibacter europaeus TaxID=744859 RepID=A0A2T4VWW9_9HYPH|nr:hypothetical protein [Candidatus Liberibacter europaeus]PTL86269.1 MAG: hypothetical protein C4617_04495 [Candidatus Liberibacter europaeus]
MNREEQQKFKEKFKDEFKWRYINNFLSDPKLINEIKLVGKHDIQTAVLMIRDLILEDMKNAYEKFFNSSYRKFLKTPKNFEFKQELPAIANELSAIVACV